jgi:ankyrin repeat protein
MKRLMLFMVCIFLIPAIFAEAGIADSNTPLIQAAENANLHDLQTALTDGANVNTRNDKNATALMLASMGGYTEIVKLLLNKGADVNVKEPTNGRTALMMASEKGYAEIVKYLLVKGADANIRDTKNGATALMWASQRGHTEIVRLLLDKGADVNAKAAIDGGTSLMLAAENNHPEVVKILLDNGADANIKNKNGVTASWLASYKGYNNIAEMLLAKGSNVNDKNNKGVDGETQWFLNLVKTNNGKTFCAPRSATLKELVEVFYKYSKAHPEFHDQLTDKQTIQGLAETYPCTVQATPELMNTDISKLGPKNIMVTATGEYASIDTKKNIAIMQKLLGTSAHENDGLADQIVKDSGSYEPPVLFALAGLFYRQGDIDNAIFWFNAARLRGSFDAVICTDISARSAISALVYQIPRDLIKKQFDDIPKLKSIISSVLKWDETTLYKYDHRWISLHGMNAINSGIGLENGGGPLTVPRESWDAEAKKNREQYRKSFDDALAMLQKQNK